MKQKKKLPHFPLSGNGERPEGKTQADQKVWAALG